MRLRLVSNCVVCPSDTSAGHVTDSLRCFATGIAPYNPPFPPLKLIAARRLNPDQRIATWERIYRCWRTPSASCVLLLPSQHAQPCPPLPQHCDESQSCVSFSAATSLLCIIPCRERRLHPRLVLPSRFCNSFSVTLNPLPGIRRAKSAARPTPPPSMSPTRLTDTDSLSAARDSIASVMTAEGRWGG